MTAAPRRQFLVLAAVAVPGCALPGCAQHGPRDAPMDAMNPCDGPGGRGPMGEGSGGPERGRPPAPPGALNSAAAARQYVMAQSRAQLEQAQGRLKITAEQLPLWERYAASVGALMTDVARGLTEDPRPGGLNALQRIDRRVDIARNRYAALEDIAAALRPLYASFDAEQRQRADQLLAGTVPSVYDGAALPFSPGGVPMERAGPGPNDVRGRGRPPGGLPP